MNTLSDAINGVILTPRPASTELYITLGKALGDGVLVELYNQNGRLMMNESEKAPNGVMKLNVSDLPGGVYSVIIRNGVTVAKERAVIVK